jgi:hypothetical protein
MIRGTSSIVAGSRLHFELESDSRPPTNFCIAASNRFPRLLFRLLYANTVRDFCGYQVIRDGQVLDQYEDEMEKVANGEAIYYD